MIVEHVTGKVISDHSVESLSATDHKIFLTEQM